MCTTPATPLIVGSTASAIILPLDILDLVFAEIAQDAKTLSQCSLVCKFWSAGARRQLFRTVILAIRSSDSLTDIVGFLQDFRANSHWIRNVIFRGFWEPLRPSLLVTCLDMLPELHSLVLDQVELGWEDNAQLEAGPTPKCRLGTLDLRRVSFLNPHNLMGVICVFAEIHTIIATHVDTWLERDLLMDATTWEPCSPDFTRPTVQKFKATEVFPFQSVAWLYKALATRTSPGSLTSLDFACVTMKNVHSFCAWLSAEGSRTTSLRLDLSPSGSLMDPRAPVRYDHAADHATSRGFDIHLQQIGLTDLKSLTIVGGTNRVTDVKDHVVRAFGWANLISIVQSAPVGLTHLGVEFVTSKKWHWDLEEGLNWQDLTRALSGFQELRVISFSRDDSDFSDKEIAVFREYIGKFAVSLQFL